MNDLLRLFAGVRARHSPPTPAPPTPQIPPEWGSRAEVTTVEADLSEVDSIRNAIVTGGAECVIHLAAKYAWWAKDGDEFRIANVVSSETCYKRAKPRA